MKGDAGGNSLHIIERVRFLPPLHFHIGWLPVVVASCSMA